MSGPARHPRGMIALLIVPILLVTGCARGGAPGTGPVTLKETRKAEVHALWFAAGPERSIGGTSRVSVTVEPNADNEVRVGFFETEVGGSGPMWRASGWMAVVMATLLLGIDINNYKFTFDVSGQIDGSSAGGLMTATVLSLLLGDGIKPDASITGTINPDGTIGPVSGIPQKLEGAAKAGKKLVLIPLGQRFDEDANIGTSVDTVEKGQRLGIEVREVGDIYQAYEALTGKALPRPEGIADGQPSLSSAAFQKVKAKAEGWVSRYKNERETFLGVEEDAREPFVDLLEQADAAGDKASSYFDQGLMAGAYARALEAGLLMTAATEQARLTATYLRQGPGAARDHLRTLQSATQIDGLIDRLKAEKPKTSSDALVLADAYANLAVALGLVELAEENLGRTPQSDEENMEFLVTAALYYAMATHSAKVANERLDIGLRGGTSPAPDPKRLERFAETLRRAAEANLNYFDATVINDIAAEQGIRPDEVRQALYDEDWDYTFALATIKVLPRLQERLGGGEAGSYATLGAALASYVFSSATVAKYDSLDAEFDPDGNIIGVARERAMTHMLDFGEKGARELIALARKTGNDPVLPVIDFENAKIGREGAVREKLGALQSFWRSGLEAKLMAIFSGSFKLAR